MKKLLLISMCVAGCSVPIQQRASVIGQSSKVAIEETYAAWDELANARISKCERTLDPEEDTKADYDKCVGPYNEQVQEKIVFGLKVVQAAQLTLFIALAQDKSDDEIKRATADLMAAVTDFIKLVQENQ